MYGLYSLVKELRETMNDNSDRIWSFDKKVQAVQAAIAALGEYGIYQAKTYLGVFTADSTFYYPLPKDIEPNMVFRVYMPSTSSADPLSPIGHWGIEARGETNMLALYRAYPDSRNLRVEYLAPFDMYPTYTTLSSTVTAVATSMQVTWAADWSSSGFAELWPRGSTNMGEVVYYGAKTSTVVGQLQRAIKGRPSAFAVGDMVGPAMDIGPEIRNLVLLYAEAECWRLRQAMSPRSQYLQNYANLEIKARRNFEARVTRVRTRLPSRIQTRMQPRYGPSTAPSTVKEYFERG